MSLFEERDIERPRHVTVTRETGGFDGDGDVAAATETVAEDMPADIQFSLRVRSLQARDGSGTTDATAWLMFCRPPAPLCAGDLVADGAERFAVEAAADWGTHTECVMRRVES